MNGKATDKNKDKNRDKNKDKRGNGHAPRAGDRAELKNLRKRIKELETEVAQFEREIATIDGKLADAGLHAERPAEAASLAKTRASTALRLARVEEEWLAISTRGEELNRSHG